MANTYLDRTPSGAGNSKTFTISCWIKRSKISYDYSMFYTAGLHQSTLMSQLYFIDDDKLLFGAWNSNGSTNHYIATNRVFRDTSAWYHIVVAVDTTQATAANRVKIYVNGTQETSLDTTYNYPAQNFDYAFNQTLVHNIGRRGDLASSYHDGYLSHVVMVDGQALAPTVFGETDSTSGIWKFKSPSGVTWGTNGFHLKFESSGNLGLDSSGNSNTFTVNGNGRQALDTPSNVHATLNPLSTPSTLSNGNLQAVYAGSGSYATASSTLGMTSGKYYCEVKLTLTNNYPATGICATNSDHATILDQADWLGRDADTYGMYTNSGDVFNNGSSVNVFGAISTGDIIGMALDLDSAQNTLKYYKNGSLIGTQNITTNSNGWMFGCTNQSTGTTNAQFNFGNGYFGTTAVSSAGTNASGNGIFEYDVPTGYTALSTKGLNT